MVRRFWQTFVLIVVFAFGAPASATTVSDYGRLPAIDSVEISDDGTMLAYVLSSGEQQQVVVQRIEGGEILRRIAYNASKIRGVEWAGPEHVIIIRSVTTAQLRRFYRGEFMQAASLNIRTGNIAQLPTRVLGNSRIAGESLYENVIFNLHTGSWRGEAVAYAEGVARTGVGQPDLLRFNLDSGVAQVVHLGSEETDEFLYARDGTLLARSEYTSSSGHWRLTVRDGNNWRQVYETRALLDAPYMSGLSADGSAVLLHVQEADGSIRVRPVSLANGEIGAELTPSGPGEFFLEFDRNYRNIGTSTLNHYPAYQFYDPSLQADWNQLAPSFPNRVVRLVSATPDYSKLVVYIEGTEHPGSYMIYNRSGPSLDMIANAYPTIENIAEVRAINYRAADGLQLSGYVTLPTGRAPRGLPLVVLPHGGPEGRDTAGYDWIAQALASRGYAVFQPNFRGSDTSASLLAAGYGEWGQKMQTDVSDGVAYLASQGMVDASRACVMGASYGGYVALAGVTIQSGIYRCAVAIAPVSDPPSFVGRAIAVSGSDSGRVRYWLRFMGATSVSDPHLQEISPLANAAQASAPVLLIHGRDDTTVEYSQSADMAAALRRAGRDVELVDLRQEDHGLSQEPTRVQAITSALSFIERHNPPN
jgi:dipeptidyl aminopeptidase/acylaminoacyl peptidase